MAPAMDSSSAAAAAGKRPETPLVADGVGTQGGVLNGAWRPATGGGRAWRGERGRFAIGRPSRSLNRTMKSKLTFKHLNQHQTCNVHFNRNSINLIRVLSKWPIYARAVIQLIKQNPPNYARS